MSMVHIEVFTAHHVIRGLINTSGERLTDILNNRTQSSLILKQVEVARLFSLGQEAPFSLDNASVAKVDILFAKPAEQDRTEKSIFRKTTRQLFLLNLLVDNFEISGRIHLSERMQINRVLIVRTEDFIPLTDARAIYAPKPTINFPCEMLVFNKAKTVLVGEKLLPAVKETSV